MRRIIIILQIISIFLIKSVYAEVNQDVREAEKITNPLASEKQLSAPGTNKCGEFKDLSKLSISIKADKNIYNQEDPVFVSAMWKNISDNDVVLDQKIPRLFVGITDEQGEWILEPATSSRPFLREPDFRCEASFQPFYPHRQAITLKPGETFEQKREVGAGKPEKCTTLRPGRYQVVFSGRSWTPVDCYAHKELKTTIEVK